MSTRKEPPSGGNTAPCPNDEYMEFISAECGRLTQENKRLRRLVEAQNNTIADAAHNLKNPLTSIILSASMLQKRLVEGMLPETLQIHAKRYLSSILSIAERMSEILSRLLDARRLFAETEAMRFKTDPERASKQLSLKMQAVEFAPLVRLMVEEYRLRAGQKNITLKYEENLTKHAWIHADRCATTEIIENLLSNAIKYSEPGSAVLVRLSERVGVFGEQILRLIVEDSGEGMSADEVLRVFQPNANISTIPTSGEESHGIGLSIAKRYAEAMSFVLTCRSHKGAGTQFVLSATGYSLVN